MKFYGSFILIAFKLSFNAIQCQLIFEDDFETLDLNKWDIVGEKANCAKMFDGQNTCNTNNEVNVRAINGKLAITANYNDYFEGSETTATILSKQTFKLNSKSPSLLFKVRASLPIFEDLEPKIFLFTHNQFPPKFIDVLNFKDLVSHEKVNKTGQFNQTINEKFSGILADFPGQNSNLTGNIDLRNFQEYEMIFNQNHFIWRLNGKKLTMINGSDPNYKDGNNNFSYEPDSFDLEYKLGITLNILKRLPWQKINLCFSLILDYINVYENIESANYPVNLLNFDPEEDANDICEEVSTLEEQSYIKFNPENYPLLLFSDEFDGNTLDDKWSIETNEDECKASASSGSSNVCDHKMEISDGKLKLFATKTTGPAQIIASKVCFKNVRIEIRARMPVGSGIVTHLYMQAYKDGCNKGNVKGRLDIFAQWDCSECLRTVFYVGEDKSLGSYYQDTHVNYTEYQTFGVEWNDKWIQWFINDRVIYSSNRETTMDGYSVSDTTLPNYLPFEHPFNLLFSVRFDSNYLDEDDDWLYPWLEIDYVRIYGENKSGIVTDPDSQASNPSSSKGIFTSSNILLMGMSLLFLLVVTLITVIAFVLRRQKKRIDHAQNELFYDDVKDDTYEYIEVNVYETINHNDMYKIDDNPLKGRDYLKIESHYENLGNHDQFENKIKSQEDKATSDYDNIDYYDQDKLEDNRLKVREYLKITSEI